jgi:hypothetical protein
LVTTSLANSIVSIFEYEGPGDEGASTGEDGGGDEAAGEDGAAPSWIIGSVLPATPL